MATNTESAKNAGNAILYECVLTIMAIEVESGLRVLAINILGRFLINRDNNIRYVALNTLHKVVASDPQAVQRHRNTIVDCLKDADSSIRQRALELVYALVNEANVKILVKELLSYLIACDVEFKDELTQRICHVVEKYAKDHEWHVDTIIQTLSVSNTFTNEETVPPPAPPPVLPYPTRLPPCHSPSPTPPPPSPSRSPPLPSPPRPHQVCSMIALITSNPPVQGYATHKLYSVLAAKSNQPVLLQLGVWCIGEYGELLVGSAPPEGTEGETPDQVAVVKLLEGVLRSPVATTVTKEYTLNALMKLTTRFSGPAVQLLQQQLASYNTSMSLELQQRSVEYSALLRLDSIRSGVLERMPAFEKKEKAPPTDDGMGMGSMGGGGGGGGDLVGGIATPSAPVAVASAPAPAASEMDLLSDILGAGPTPTPAAAPMGMPGAAAAPPPGAGGMDMSLMDLLGGGPAAPAATRPPAARWAAAST